ncbi:Coat protein (modular protein) [uncultured Thiomicrorhabdus sp.]
MSSTPKRTPARRQLFPKSPKRRRIGNGGGIYRKAGYYGRYRRPAQELKWFDTAKSAATVASTGVIWEDSINHLTQGAGESARIGRKATLTAVNFRAVVQLNDTTTVGNTDDGMRIILYVDSQTNGAAPAITDILETAEYLSFNTLVNTGRFRILMDKYIDISATAGAYNGASETSMQVAKTVTFYKRCQIPLEFDGATGAIAELRTNNVGILAITDAGLMTLRTNCRVRFSDT